MSNCGRGAATKDEQHCWKSEVDSKARRRSRLPQGQAADKLPGQDTAFRGVARDAWLWAEPCRRSRSILNTVFIHPWTCDGMCLGATRPN